MENNEQNEDKIVPEENKETTQVENKTEQTKEPQKQENEKQDIEKAKQVEVKKDEEKQQATKEPKKEGGNSKKKLIISISIIVIAAIIALVLFFVLKTKTIDLSECLSIKYDGYNGHATAIVTLDEKALKKKIDDSSVVNNFAKKSEIELENYKNLSNGDELIVKVKIPSSFLERNKLKLKETTIKVKVTGIEEATSIDMSKYIKIEYTGYNKHATAKATLITDKMDEDLGEDISSKLANRMNLTIVNNENLSNEDELEVKIDINSSYLEEIGINLNSDTVKIKVEGLEEAEEIDAFKDIKVDVTGMSPNISVSISNNSEDELLKTVQYKASKTSGIANGETITITATKWDEELFNEKAIVLKETKMEYTVKGQAAYIFSLSEINDTVKSELKSIFISKATSKANEKYSRYEDNLKYYLEEETDYGYLDFAYGDIDKDLTFGTPEVMSMYLLTKKNDANVDDINIITAIVKVPCKSAKSGVTYNWYVTIQGKNASLKSDGTISDNTTYSITANKGKDEETAYQEYINSKKNKYNVEKISL